MRVHVTGGSGFLGSKVIPALIADHHDVTAMARSDAAAAAVEALGAEPIRADLDDPASIDDAFMASGGEGLVDLASLGFGHAPAIVAAAEEAGLQRAVFVSTTSIYTRLATSSKGVRLAAEDAVRASSLDWTIVRPTMIYGTPADRNMAWLLRALRRLPVLPLPGGGNGLQQPVHVEDLAGAIVAALANPVACGREYNLAGPEAISLRAVVEQAGVALGRRPRLIPVPLWAARGVLRVYEHVASSPRVKAEQVARLGEDKAVDIGLAQADLGFAPRSFGDGIRAEAALVS